MLNTVKFEENVFEVLPLMAGNKTLNDFIAEAACRQPERDPMEYEKRRRRVEEAVRGRVPAGPVKREEATHRLCGLLGYTDGHEVDRFLERRRAGKERELAKEAAARADSAKWRKS
jgi:hypothetical protein